MIDITQRIILTDDTLLQDVENEAVLINLSTQRYYALNAVGARMLQALTSNSSIEQAYSVLIEEYEVDEAILSTDLQNLIEDLLSEGLVTIV